MEFHLTIDFGDDILYAKQEWTEEWLRKLVRGYGERGISAVHILHTHDLARAGAWAGYNSYFQFLDKVPNPIAVVADECHKHGMLCYSVIKFNDRYGGMPFAPGPVTYNSKGEIEQDFLGGKARWKNPWVRDHQNMRAELHPLLQEKYPRKPIGTIRLWHEGQNLQGTNFKIYTSQNNREYFPYLGPQKVTVIDQKRKPPVYTPAPDLIFGPEGVFTCIEFTGLKIDAPFFAIEANGGTELANTLSALTEIQDVDGKEAIFTYGVVPLIVSLLDKSQRENWKKNGIAFDAAKGSDFPGRGCHFMSSGGRHRLEVKKRGFVGFARGRNRYLTAVLELANPEARNWCAETAKFAVDSGCDFVDIRMNTHTESLDWENYGFGDPIVEEYKRRYGKDITKDPFDRALWRCLRGEYVNQTIKAMGDVMRSSGRKVSVQLLDRFNHPPDELCFMEFFWDWKKWLTEGLVDSATLAGFSWKDPFYKEAIETCKANNIPLIMTPAMFDANDDDWKRDGPIYFDAGEKDGFHAFNIYESAAVSLLDVDGLYFTCPSLWKMIKERKK